MNATVAIATVDQRFTRTGTPSAFVGQSVISADQVSRLDDVSESLVHLVTALEEEADPGLAALLKMVAREVTEIRQGAEDLASVLERYRDDLNATQ